MARHDSRMIPAVREYSGSERNGMSVYGFLVRGLKKATTFHGLRPRSSPRLGKDPLEMPGLRPRSLRKRVGLRRHRESPRGPLLRLALLAWPAVITAGILIPIHDPAAELWHQRGVDFHLWVILASGLPLSLAGTLHAWTATDTRAVRYPATLLNLLFPLHVAWYWLAFWFFSGH